MQPIHIVAYDQRLCISSSSKYEFIMQHHHFGLITKIKRIAVGDDDDDIVDVADIVKDDNLSAKKRFLANRSSILILFSGSLINIDRITLISSLLTIKS
ncbi:hypothetical protein DERP_010634 [Dermatophagoides pteronyssinus]|uniref:Uncharacterized protein n=1 Tax=Dermatophagoides pteronyssinus TaxID=6956 RepID=A0ABQ8J9Z2_DERPT|nr:hypothetical protein DERP_010634 [Dermatophagoides pteronyssinus]